MSVRVGPTWRKTPGKYLVTIRFRWPNGNKCRDRKEIEARSDAAARKWGEARESELRAAGPPKSQAEETPRKKAPLVSIFSVEWIEKHARADLHKDSGVDSQESILRIHVLPFVGSMPLDELTDEVIAELKGRWIAGGYEYTDQHGRLRAVKATRRRKTLNNRLSVVSTMLDCAYQWKRIDHLPCRIRMLKVDDEEEADFYEHETYERIVAAAERLDPRIHAVVLLGGDAGLRRGEILGYNQTDTEFTTARLRVRRSVYWKKGKAIENEKPKGGKAKPVPATPRLLSALRKCRHLRGERLLYTDDGAALTPKVLKSWIMRAERLAGLPETGRVHIFRHTFCSHLAMAGVPARTIQELARHGSLAVTMRYMHLSPNATEEGIEMLTRSRADGGRAATDRAHRRSSGESSN